MDTKEISAVVLRHAKERPEQVAMVFENRATTYGQLEEHVNQVANGLLALDVRRQERVAILDQNSDQFYEVWLGGSRIGAVTVALNARLSVSEAKQVLLDARPKVLFIGAGYSEMLTKLRGELEFIERIIVTGEEFRNWRSGQSTDTPSSSPLEDDVCLQLYTSGTTGAAKGVQLTNINAVSAFFPTDTQAPSPWTSMSPADVLLVILPHGHIAGCGAGLSGLIAGGRLVILREFIPSDVIAKVRDERVTIFIMVPMMIRALVASLQAGSRDCESLRMIMYGAAPMPTASLKQAMAAFPGVDFGQVYGLTETFGPTTFLNANDHRAIAAGNEALALSCGRALPDTEIRIVSVDGHHLASDQIGEVICRGRHIMKGYWNRAAENNEVMRNGWFHTGDIGSMDANGYLYLHDRKRDMIITGGENVYPADVENVLYSHPAVAEGAVFGVPDSKWGEAVKAVVVLKPGAAASEAEIIAHLKERLAGFKVPKSVDFAESLPRNPTGKVLRRMLREPYWQGHTRQVA